MESKDNILSFTVVIPTRNRPAMFLDALRSVLAQDYVNFNVVVVNDGSDDAHIDDYKKIQEQHTGRVKWIYQPQRPNGHGQSYSMNSGVYASDADYISFLDDDDVWSDTQHLSRVAAVIEEAGGEPDVLYANQNAFDHEGNPSGHRLWISDRIDALDQAVDCDDDSYSVSREFLLDSSGFAHLNCTVIRRELYLRIGGMDEAIRYECDRDFFLRTIDAAEEIRFLPVFIARHNIPDPRRKDNMSTLVSSLEKRIYQYSVFQKSALFAGDEAVSAACREGLAITCKQMVSVLVDSGSYEVARAYAMQAQGLHPTLKWGLYCQWIKLRALFG